MLNKELPFMDSVTLTIPYLQARSLGGALMTLGHLVFALHFFMIGWKFGAQAAGCVLAGAALPVGRCPGRYRIAGASADGQRTRGCAMSARLGRWEMDELRLVVGSMVILSLATALLVVMPYLLLKNVPPPADLKPYTKVQLEGRQVYIANGCVYCHSQQPRDIAQAPDATRGWGSRFGGG